MIALAFTLASCTKAQGTAIENATVDATVCVLNHSQEPPEKIAVECGIASVPDVLKVVDAHRAAEAREQALAP
jgi:hypothetical protein